MKHPGWYPDGAGQVRFWDGEEWTPYTSIPAFDAIGRSDPTVLPPPSESAEEVVWDPPRPAEFRNMIGVAGFAIGAMSVFLPFIAGLVGGLLGLAVSILGAADRGPGRPWAIAGIVLSVLAIVLLY